MYLSCCYGAATGEQSALLDDDFLGVATPLHSRCTIRNRLSLASFQRPRPSVSACILQVPT